MTSAVRHPVEMIETFIKSAEVSRTQNTPYGTADMPKAMNRTGNQRYAKPQSPVGQTDPSMTASQKVLPPPPV